MFIFVIVSEEHLKATHTHKYNLYTYLGMKYACIQEMFGDQES